VIDIVKVETIGSDSVPSTTSLKIAEVFGKRHDDVIKAIENHIAEGEFNGRNFAVVDYKDKKGELRKMYILDERFTTFLVMGFTGKEAAKWKLQYIDEFQRMREELKNKVIRETGDRYALADKLQKMVLDSKRKELEGKEGHIGLYCQISRRTNELAFGYHEKDIRQNISQKQAMSLNKAFEDTIKTILDGVTNPSKIKEVVEEKRGLSPSKETKKLK
jgi:Rha family phage regulatory protein